ncbi:MmcQ/YjbR family DNA-binding protein [Caldimonas sp. KR1-144]|uniref:MmcQ/YjbR family DNA-binding protein n=1 Tax=Caldimonas sp. KR1-144 TaxID=3400911 RepID=UPI003C09690C
MKLAEVRRIALALPEVVEQPHHDFTSFRVRGKIFATAPPAGSHVHLFVDEPTRGLALAMHPEIAEKLLWGGKVMGLRVALADAQPAVVKDWLRRAWRRKAPMSLHG